MMRLNVFLLLSFWLIIGNLTAQEISGNLEILVPRSHNPAFAEPNDTITIEIRSTDGLSETGWTGYLKNDLASWSLPVISAKLSIIHHGTEEGWMLKAVVPGQISPELMNLEIIHTSSKTGGASRSVSVVPSFENDFYILHQSDQHLTNDLAVEPGGRAHTKWGNGSKQALNWLTPVLNLINPRFLLESGDNCQIYHGAKDWVGLDEALSRTQRFLNGFADCSVPTVLTTGNHDIGFSDYMLVDEWRKSYNSKIGQRAYSFKMGSFYVLSYEWTNDEFRDWAKADFQSTFSDPSVKYRLLTSHFYDGLKASSTLATESNPADLMLVGHNHQSRILQTTPYPVLSVAAAQDHQKAAFFDFKRTANGWSSSQVSGHAERVNVHRMVGDNGIPTVFETFDKVNNGTKKSNKVLISNQLPFNFYDGRVRFLMKKGEYDVRGGEVLASYPFDKGKKTAVLVKVNIKADTVTPLTVEKKKREKKGEVLIDNNARWNDTDGKEIRAQGGCILEVDNKYHWIGPDIKGAGDFKFYAFNHYVSSDLKNWERQDPVITPESPDIPFPHGNWVARPWIFHHKATSTFVMYCEWGGGRRDTVRNRYAVLTAPDISGPWKYDTVYNRLPDMSGKTYTMGDMGGFQDDNGNAYLVYTFDKTEANRTQAIVKLDPNTFRRILPPSKGGYMAEFQGEVREAAGVIKREGTYYYFTSQCRGWRPSVTKYRTAKSMSGPWSDPKELMTDPAAEYSYRTQHDFVLPVTGKKSTEFIYCGDRWKICNPTDYEGATGLYAWFPMVFDKEGVPSLKAPGYAENGGDWLLNAGTGSWRAPRLKGN